MTTNDAAEAPETALEEMYPELTPEQRREAAYWLGRYLDVVRRIFERTHNLTEEERADTI
jgi:hypothetical protein